jgi:hypothetical protein
MNIRGVLRFGCVAMAVAAFTLVGCDSDDDGSGESTAPATSSERASPAAGESPTTDGPAITPGGDSTPAPAGLSSLLIGTQDMPADWVISEQGSAAAEAEFCDVDFPSDVEPAEHASVTFSRLRDGRFVSQYLASYDDDGAEDAISLLRDRTESCEEFTQTAPDGTTLTWRISVLTLPTIGDEDVALSATSAVETVGAVETHMVISRRGNLLNWVSYGGSPTEEPLLGADLERYARIADAKIRQEQADEG